MTISAFVITKNEESNIANCINSLNWVDEIVIVDSGSTDCTVEIAKRLNAKVYKRNFDDFSNQRNFAIEKCTGDWVFYLDADERPSKYFESELRAIESSSEFNTYRMDRLEYFMGDFIRYGGFGLGQHNHHLRFWRRGGLSFSGDVHEKIRSSERSGRLSSYILHYSNEGNVSGFISKLNSYTTIEADEFAKTGNNLNGHSLFVGPLKRFLARFFIWGGYKDGLRGLVFISLHFFYDFVSAAKKIEILNARNAK